MNTLRKFRPRVLLALTILVGLCTPVLAQTAFLELENQSGDPRTAYLSPVMEGLLLYDLSEKGGIDLLERKNLRKIVAEQEFQASVLENGSMVSSLGKLANASFLLFGGYTVGNGEVFLTLQLATVATGEVYTIRERGQTEHVVHWAAEKLIKRINGRSLQLADASNNRSLLLLRDETPGTLALHSRLIGAKIYIDGEFAGFTKGDEKTALIFSNLPPGKHTVRTYLANNFGIFYYPEPRFGDWETVVDIRPGRQTAIIDESLMFYDAFARLIRVSTDRKSAPLKRISQLNSQKTSTYPMPDGKTRTVSIQFLADETKGQLAMTLNLETTGMAAVQHKATIALPVMNAGNTDHKIIFGDLELSYTFSLSGEDYRFYWELERKDLDADRLER